MDKPLSEPAGCQGLFLKLGQTEPPGQFVFATLRLAWQPARADESLGVTQDMVWLGEQGIDVGLFDSVRVRNRKPIDSSEQECFYQLLAAISRAKPQELTERAQEFELGPLLQDPRSHHGDVVMVRGTARRVQRIVLTQADSDVRKRFGIDHYYQVDVFVPLGEQKVQLAKGSNDKSGPVFSGSFPVTLCVRRVPEALEEGKSLDVDVAVPAVFFKVWEFPSKYVQQFGDWNRQPAPLLFGLEPVVLPRQKAPPVGASFGFAIALAVVGALGGAWFGVWQSTRARWSALQ